MEGLSGIYSSDVAKIATLLRVEANFDVIEKKLDASGQQMTFFYIDGFVKDGVMQRIMQFLMSEKNVGNECVSSGYVGSMLAIGFGFFGRCDFN